MSLDTFADLVFMDTDADAGDSHSLSVTFEVTGVLGAVVHNLDGTFSYDPANGFQHLGVGKRRRTLCRSPRREGPLLDNTLLLFGSACSTTHNARNYPLVLAGGKTMGVKHASYSVFDDQVPMSNLLVSMLNAVGVETRRFSDSTGELPGKVFS